MVFCVSLRCSRTEMLTSTNCKDALTYCDAIWINSRKEKKKSQVHKVWSQIIKSKINHAATSFHSTLTCTTFRFGRRRERVKWDVQRPDPPYTGAFQVVWGYYRFDYWVSQGNWLKWGLTALEGSKQLESSSLPAAILRPFRSQVPQLLWSVIKA